LQFSRDWKGNRMLKKKKKKMMRNEKKKILRMMKKEKKKKRIMMMMEKIIHSSPSSFPFQHLNCSSTEFFKSQSEYLGVKS
jgi:hypothetical protein